jgi:hypothetical protein
MKFCGYDLPINESWTIFPVRNEGDGYYFRVKVGGEYYWSDRFVYKRFAEKYRSRICRELIKEQRRDK